MQKESKYVRMKPHEIQTRNQAEQQTVKYYNFLI